MDKIKSIKLSIFLTHIFFCLLIAFTIILPKAVIWYVETMGREKSLPTTIMVTCYPCVPFVAASLICIRRLLRNVLFDKLFQDSSVRYLSYISAFSLIIAIITIIAGKFYLPFFIVSVTFTFLALLVFALRNVFALELSRQKTKLSAKEGETE